MTSNLDGLALKLGRGSRPIDIQENGRAPTFRSTLAADLFVKDHPVARRDIRALKRLIVVRNPTQVALGHLPQHRFSRHYPQFQLERELTENRSISNNVQARIIVPARKHIDRIRADSQPKTI